jgi:plasmid stabilization system protein ParE
MKYELLLKPESVADISESYDWYENKISDLGNSFIMNIEATLKKILKMPESFPLVYKNIRRGLTKKFPYGVYFLIEEDKVIVLAVIHLSRSPKTLIKIAN